MTSHVHLIIGTDGTNKLQDIIRDLKAFTSRHIRKAIEEHSGESRKEWLLWMLGKAGSIMLIIKIGNYGSNIATLSNSQIMK